MILTEVYKNVDDINNLQDFHVEKAMICLKKFCA